MNINLIAAKLFLSLTLLMSTSIASAKLSVFACEPEWKSLVDELGGEHVSSISATTAFQDPHHIEARPSLIAKLRQADLLVCTGAELEIGWLPMLQQKSANKQIQNNHLGYFMASEHVALLDAHTHVDRSMGDVHAAGNPHMHLDPHRLLRVAKKLAKRLRLLDSENAEYYHQRFDVFEKKWQFAITQWEQDAQALKGMQVVVQHANWRYLFEWLGIEVVADLEPKPGLPPSTSHLVSILESLNMHNASMIAVAAYQSATGANWLANKTDIPVVTLPFTVGGTQEATDLFSLYQITLSLLLNNVKQEKTD
ncbi:MAG: zinc/manganese transport system substrate-binding protein [Oleiphilaceae bacterium]|jgi:zinc/manganese transport system substrate-binding protein